MSLSVRRVIKPKKGIIRGQLVVLGLLDGVPVVVLADGVLTFGVAALMVKDWSIARRRPGSASPRHDHIPGDDSGVTVFTFLHLSL